MAHFKKDAIKADTDCRLLPELLGLKTNRSGSTLFCECVPRTHPETKISHVSVRKEGAHCFLSCPGCRGNFDCFGMVMEARHCDFSTACEELIRYLGGDRARYTDDGPKKMVAFPYSREQITLYGFEPQTAYAVLRDLYERDAETVSSLIDYKGGETIEHLRQIRDTTKDPDVREECQKRLSRIREILESQKKAGN